MKRFLALTALIAAPALSLFAQDKEDKQITEVSKPSRDFLMLQFTHDSWANVPDSIRIGGVGRGFSGYLNYDFPIKNSSFSFAAGVGISISNVYLKDQEINFKDSLNQVVFRPESIDYKRYKMTTTYVEAPFELRYFGNKHNRNRGFKAAVGVKVGAMMGAYTKGRYTHENVKFSDKELTRRYMETWRFSGTVRAGWGNFSVVGTYGLTNLFKEGEGPGVVPYSIGICISGL